MHAGRNLEFQDFRLAVPHGLPGYSEALRAVVGIHRATRELLEDSGYQLTGVAGKEEDGGRAFPTNEAALEILTRAIEKSGLRASQAGFDRDRRGGVRISTPAVNAMGLRSEGRSLDSSGDGRGCSRDWTGRFPICSIEDGLAEDDWDGWRLLTEALGDAASSN